MKPSARTHFHYRYYRYVRMMLRRYPKMRRERLSLSSNHGVDAICGNSHLERLQRALGLQ